MRRFLVVAIALGSLAAVGCQINNGGKGGVVCTEIFAFGVNVSVTDENGDPVPDAVLTLTEGDYTETFTELRPGEYAGAGERAGTYELTVAAEGFETVTIDEIVVDEDECHVIPVAEDVSLAASP